MPKIVDTINNTNGAYIIAEIGVNYYDIAKLKNISVMDAAKLMIDEAKRAGCHAAKFQTYKAGKIVSKHSPAYWDQTEEATSSQYELFTKFDSFAEDEYIELSKYCDSIGITFLSTPFDFDSADYLCDLMPLYKISSSDLTNIPFLKHIAKKQKPIILSTGAAFIGEIETAINVIYNEGNINIFLMHCILDYPTNYEDANLLMIKHLKKVFPELTLGFSDHTRPDETMLVLTTAYQYGAKLIEKHFTLDKTLSGNDHYHAMDVDDCQKFVMNLNLLKKINGEYIKKPLPCEAESRKQARRSIIAEVKIPKGTVITEDMLSFKRPGTGISPGSLELVLGRVTQVDIEQDDIMQWEMI